MGSQSIGRGNVRTAQGCLGGWGLFYKASRSYFLGLGKLAKGELEGCNWCLVSLTGEFPVVLAELGSDLQRALGHQPGSLQVGGACM